MSSCSIDHSKESVLEKLESQKPYLPSSIYQSCSNLLLKEPSQHILNELFHLLKKYDLKDEAEQQDRDKKIKALVE
ncbi:hypothetical protein ACE1TI_09460 [Alteribacillus sp. JSM 102045]|uniref:hypothetical protein n=1 Tax=Alteribacillus sp. JSM 102045 TaxID=1562101 RepID=UPI0035BFFF6A